MLAKNYKKLDLIKINNYSDRIINNIKEESVAAYCFLQGQWKSNSAIENKLFQFVYRSFYRMDNAGITDQFKERYFYLLEINRSSEKTNLKEISDNLRNLKNRKGQESLQFSFITKLASTVDTQLPIYDEKIAKAYNFSNYYISDYDLRFLRLMDFYNFLKKDYESIINENKLIQPLASFDKMFCDYKDTVSQVKKIDFILWSAGKLAALNQL